MPHIKLNHLESGSSLVVFTVAKKRTKEKIEEKMEKKEKPEVSDYLQARGVMIIRKMGEIAIFPVKNNLC